MGELVEVLERYYSNLWSGAGSCSPCMSKCNLTVFLDHISAAFRHVHVLDHREPTMQWVRLINSGGPTIESRVVKVTSFAAMAYQCRHELMQLHGPLLPPSASKHQGDPEEAS